MDEAEKTGDQNHKTQLEKKQKEKEQEEKEKEIYESMEKPINEVVEENNLDQVKVNSDTANIHEMKNYTDATEFSKYVAKVLYDFYTIQMDSRSYYNFMKNYGSKDMIADLPSEKDAITFYTTLQDMYKQKGITGDGYVITEVIFDAKQTEGHFYRKLTTTNGVEYFITTITKEKDGWKFVEDSPSPPFEEISKSNQNGK